ncbi:MULTISPECIES: TetR family transcriptional regulator [unclassified Streptomyces]|uniref:TetR family transcriptional regulator n=1 Tax=unclassified Streptomyces TaxID=2593676 RepID=UPI00081DAD34|nr:MULTISPECIES: TetR family transcriptional regulator [unclassified Streptomyces]MYZ35799.1 TetR family transcriptional regulator [Streptomyces sp. SID4917]SCF78461.1 transcriptional regulator, TetR family [Streptomyces sp. MnatMP-M17]
MGYDSAATRARLLDAAFDEFVRVGLAGARVDRIAAAASANKQAIYAYYGSKDALFDAVLADRLTVLADLVPFTPADLPGYTGALLDALTADPGLLRLTQWKALERPGASHLEREAHVTKAVEIAEAYGVGVEAGMDILMLVVVAAQAWATTAPEIRNPNGADEAARLVRHRAAMTKAVRAAIDATLPATT